MEYHKGASDWGQDATDHALWVPFEVAFRLPTTVTLFLQKVQRHTGSAASRLFAMERNFLSLQRSRLGYRPGLAADGITVIEIPARISSDSEGVVRIEPIEPVVIEFEVRELASERIKVTARCCWLLVMDYFNELLEDIGRDWPETGLARVPIPTQGETAAAPSGGGKNQQDPKTKSKRGPRNYSKEEKIAARKAWDEWDRDKYPITLEEYLENKFGANPHTGDLNVPRSTFYGWPKS